MRRIVSRRKTGSMSIAMDINNTKKMPFQGLLIWWVRAGGSLGSNEVAG